MPYVTLRITRRLPDADDGDGLYSGDWLRLEQAPWLEPPDGGFLEWMTDNGLGLSLATLEQYWSEYKSFCDDDGVLEVEVYVYRSRLDLPYTLTASFGELASGAVGEASRTEYVSVALEDSYELDVAVSGAVSAEWEGPVQDSTGSEISPPTITQSGNVLSWGIEVAGTLQLQYNEERTVHILTITPRTGEDVDAENPDSAYQSTVRAFWGEGELEELDVEVPELSGNCGGTGVSVDDDDDDEQCVRKTYIVDPCTLEVLSTRTETIACPDED